MSAPSDVRISGLTKRFGGVAAVDGVSFDHDSGGVLGLIGPNGAGKTTLLNMISGVLEPTDGGIELDGVQLVGLRPDQVAAHGVARTFQNIQAFGSLSVLDNVIVAASARDKGGLWSALVPRARSRATARRHEQLAQQLLERTDVQDLSQVPMSSLPYGQQRRVEIARALATSPRLLLLDEPLAGLSRAESVDLATLMRDLAAQGLTVVLVEHDVATVMEVSDRIIVLDHGTIIADGDPKSVRSDPQVRVAYLGDELV